MTPTSTLPTHTRTELAHRASGGVDVTLFWVRCDGEDSALVRVRDTCEGVCFEIPANAYLALDVYYHPFAYQGRGRGFDWRDRAPVLRA